MFKNHKIKFKKFSERKDYSIMYLIAICEQDTFF